MMSVKLITAEKKEIENTVKVGNQSQGLLITRIKPTRLFTIAVAIVSIINDSNLSLFAVIAAIKSAIRLANVTCSEIDPRP